MSNSIRTYFTKRDLIAFGNYLLSPGRTVTAQDIEAWRKEREAALERIRAWRNKGGTP